MSKNADEQTARVSPNMPGWENDASSAEEAAGKVLRLQQAGFVASFVGRPVKRFFGGFGKKREQIKWVVVVEGRGDNA